MVGRTDMSANIVARMPSDEIPEVKSDDWFDKIK